MSEYSYLCACAGIPRRVRAGDVVSYVLPAGCVLRRSLGERPVVWDDVSAPSPFVHDGEVAHYRIDCDTYSGPVTAVLDIQAG